MQEKIVQIILLHYPQTQGVYLFGSHGTDDEWPDSDVDLALLLPPAQAKAEKSLLLSPCRLDLQEALSKEVDLLNARQVTTVFQVEIIGGTLLYNGDPYAVAEFEMLVMSYYQKLNEERRDILAEFQRTGRAYPV